MGHRRIDHISGRVVLDIAMAIKSLLLLWFGWIHLGLAENDNALHTFSFLALFYFAVFSIVLARERHFFWTTMPTRMLLMALISVTCIGTVLTFLQLPGLEALPWQQTLAIFTYAMVSCLAVNDVIKVVLIKWQTL